MSRNSRKPSVVVAGALAVSVAVLTGCGTTVSVGEAARQGISTNGLGLSTTDSTSSSQSTTPGATAASGPQATTPSVTAAGGSVDTPVAGGPAQATGGSSAVRSTKPVEIGFLVTKCGNCDLVGSSYNKFSHSEQDILQALINDKNKHGGVLGRQILPVWATEDTASSDFSTMLQSICSTFTQDHHVAAVVGAGFGYSDILGNCLAKASIPIIDAMRTTGVPDSKDLQGHPGYIISSEPELDVYNLVAYSSGVIDGWLSPKSKLGVLNYDCPGTVRVWKNVIKPYLAAQHIPVTVDYTASCIAGASDIGKAAQEVQQAVLKMRANGVDTVAITDVPLVVFSTSAESQGYHPKYLATEGGGASYEMLVSPAQIVNIHAPGWAPSFDLNASHQPPLTVLQRNCLASLTRGGLAPTAKEYVLYFALCGGLDLFLQASSKAGDLAMAKVLNAIDSLSGSFVSPFLLGGQTSFGPGKHAAALHYRTQLYNGSCKCFQYVGPSRPLPQP